ncbi:Mur ligase family protein [Staphylococcus devriesei]|uniref:Glutamate ligase n=3 Tax=Staphylococcus devriesei TaxID=586733 RepID=A0ABX5HZW1_9STAP|nr:Mur ligase family protein [Staphylococcus devriesei]MCE5090699.1 glutamate ligase [Staphylococcus devriesei]MCE5098189.1 glutamate ligase [Staphylococcus devriesei]PNZ86364.1 glutamate ligase [Staphylococcus devriesei]PTF05220.1 glutamate ligase [Staphylococcus devriesei]PTF13247.1 glutamate ligase [Staphylococcus devriesei]
MLTIEDINNIIGGNLVDAKNKESNEINDFETIYRFVKSKKTAYFSPNRETWAKELGRNKNALDGNELVDKEHVEIGLIITEKYISDLKYKTPQIIVKDSIKAFKSLAIYIRSQYKNPLIAITGSMGKSSTRMIITSLLKDYKVLENRGNNNVRAAIYTNMLKLIKNPDYAVIETSMNAINYLENTAVYLKPDIAIITGIGEAHFSTFKSIEDIAKIKSRIFEGLSKNGIAIINNDTLFADYLVDRAKLNTSNVFTYSINIDSKADFIINEIIYGKGHIEINLEDENGEVDNYRVNTISEGMVANTLASILTLRKLNIPIKKELLENFRPFSKVLAIKNIKTKSHELTLLDDTHNASLPAMVNAIRAFNSQAEFYAGNKIIAIGKINDLGHKSTEIHLRLINELEKSKADYILCKDPELKTVVNKIKNKKATWYPNKELLINDLKYLCNKDSFTLLKSSSGGTDFPELAKNLPNVLQNFKLENSTSDIFEKVSELGQSYIKINNNSGKIIESFNKEYSQTIEGLGPLIYYLKAIDNNEKNRNIFMKNWPTNNKKLDLYEGKEISLFNLLKSMTNSPHASKIYELANELFQNHTDRKTYINTLIERFNLSTSIATNLTGRFRSKERQSFSIEDLYKIYNEYKYDLFKFNNLFIIGIKYKSGFIRGESETIIFTSYKNIDQLKNKI